jgi:hypothetical protein
MQTEYTFMSSDVDSMYTHIMICLFTVFIELIPHTPTRRTMQSTLYIYTCSVDRTNSTHTNMQSKRSQTIRPTQEPSNISSKYPLVDPCVIWLRNRPIHTIQCSLTLFGIF